MSRYVLLTALVLFTSAHAVFAKNWIVQVASNDVDANLQRVRQWYTNNGVAAQTFDAAETFSIGSEFKAALLPKVDGAGKLKSLEGVNGVVTVEEEVEIKAFAVERTQLPGLDSLDPAGIDGQFDTGNNAGQGVTVVVIDTGVDVNHPELQGRAQQINLINEGGGDNNGHGTHCAGTIAGRNVGIARNAKIIGIKALNRNGSGGSGALIQGMQRVAQLAQGSDEKFVVSMSLGGPRVGGQQATSNAVNALVNAGIPVIVAAGNNGGDACQISPAFVPAAVTVGAYDPRNFQFARFSNRGQCVDISGPGVRIESADAGSQGTTVLSGTSMSTPHVAGVVAALMSDGLTGQQAIQKLLSDGRKGVIRGLPANTADLALQLIPGNGNGGDGNAKQPPAKNLAPKNAKRAKDPEAKKDGEKKGKGGEDTTPPPPVQPPAQPPAPTPEPTPEQPPAKDGKGDAGNAPPPTPPGQNPPANPETPPANPETPPANPGDAKDGEKKDDNNNNNGGGMGAPRRLSDDDIRRLFGDIETRLAKLEQAQVQPPKAVDPPIAPPPADGGNGNGNGGVVPPPGNGNGGVTPPPGNGNGNDAVTPPPGNGNGGATPPPGSGNGNDGVTPPPGNGNGNDAVTPPPGNGNDGVTPPPGNGNGNDGVVPPPGNGNGNRNRKEGKKQEEGAGDQLGNRNGQMRRIRMRIGKGFGKGFGNRNENRNNNSDDDRDDDRDDSRDDSRDDDREGSRGGTGGNGRGPPPGMGMRN